MKNYKKYEVFRGNYLEPRTKSTKELFQIIDKSKWRYPECL